MFKDKSSLLFIIVAVLILTSSIIFHVSKKIEISDKTKKIQQEDVIVKKICDSILKELDSVNIKVCSLDFRPDTDLYAILKIERAEIPYILNDKNASYAMTDNDDLVLSLKERMNLINENLLIMNTERRKLRFLLSKRVDSLNRIPSISPISNMDVAFITTAFGNHYNKKTKQLIFHAGLDFAVKVGSPVYATADGVIESVFVDKEGYGYRIIINHGNGFRTLYGHLTKFSVWEGQKVYKGKVIAKSGSTGRSSGPHLHYEVQLKYKPINPIKYLKLNPFYIKKDTTMQY